MNDPASSEIPPELREFVDAEIAVQGVRSPADEQVLNTELAAMPGVQELTISGGKIAIRYDPVSTTKVQICEKIVRAGFKVGPVEAAPASLIIDATMSSEGRGNP